MDWLRTHEEEIWYWGTFLFGLAVLFAFSYRRFDELLAKPPPPSPIVELLPGTPASSITSHRAFRRGLLAYFFVFSIVYVSLSLCQPLGVWALSHASSESATAQADQIEAAPSEEAEPPEILRERWASPVGPLLVLSLLVGLFPNLPAAREGEHMVRRLGHKIAGIPDDISNLIDDIRSKGHFEAALLPSQVATQLNILMLVARLTKSSDRDQVALERGFLTEALLGPFLYGAQAKEIWSERVRSRFDQSLERASAKSASSSEAIMDLLTDWERQWRPLLDQHLEQAGVSSRDLLDKPHDSDAGLTAELLDTFASTNNEGLSTLRSRLKQISEQYSQLAEICDAMLAVLIISDTSPRLSTAPQYLRSLITSLGSRSVSLAINGVIYASLIAGALSFLGLAALRIFKSLVREDQVEFHEILRQALKVGWQDTINLLFLFSVPICAAIFIRHWRTTERSVAERWKSLYKNESGLPLTQILSIIGWTFLLAALIQILYYLYVSVFPRVIESSVTLTEITWNIWDFVMNRALLQVLVSVVGCVAAVMVCYLLDRYDHKGRETSRTFALGFSVVSAGLIVVIFVIFQIPFVPDDYWGDMTMRGFRIERYDRLVKDLLAFGLFSSVFFNCFLTYLRPRETNDAARRIGDVVGETR